MKYYGGQAVMEGVMMRGEKHCAVAVRHMESKEINVEISELGGKRGGVGKWPFVRGVVSFIDSLVTGVKMIYRSAELAGLDELEDDEEPSRFEKWLTDKLGDKLFGVVIFAAVAFSVVFSVLLFMALPAFLASFVTPFLRGQNWAIGIIEGLTRISLLVLYLALISMMKDVKRLYAYHGAEHKTINCRERGLELTVENARSSTRLHKRCGTSFLLVVMLVSMVLFFFIQTPTVYIRVLSRIILVPVVAGASYEVIRWAGRHDGPLVDIISAPGLLLQKMTTKEPDDGQLEVAIAALKGVMEREEGSNEGLKEGGGGVGA